MIEAPLNLILGQRRDDVELRFERDRVRERATARRATRRRSRRASARCRVQYAVRTSPESFAAPAPVPGPRRRAGVRFRETDDRYSKAIIPLQSSHSPRVRADSSFRPDRKANLEEPAGAVRLAVNRGRIALEPSLTSTTSPDIGVKRSETALTDSITPTCGTARSSCRPSAARRRRYRQARFARNP